METVTNIKDHEKKNIINNDKILIDFLNSALEPDISINEFEKRLEKLRLTYKDFLPVGGKPNNAGTIGVSDDAGDSLFERVTNAIDANLEYQYLIDKDENKDEIKSPREAAEKWYNIDQDEGLKSVKPKERRKIAVNSTILRILQGNGDDERIVDVIDNGIGIDQKDFSKSILGLNESNKLAKPHTMGQFGQGGSSTFKFCKYALIVSRKSGSDVISFTVVYKKQASEKESLRSYVYPVHQSLPFCISADKIKKQVFHKGTLIRHFGYKLSKYRSYLGQGSLYLAAQKTLFNAPLPFHYIDKTKKHDRIIKGTRAALIGALDPEEKNSKLEIIHSESIAEKKINNGDFGSVKIEYWVTKKEKSVWNKEKQKREKPENKLLHHVNTYKPIIFTNNGQNQHEMSKKLIKKEMGFEYLKDNMVIHVDCNGLTKEAKEDFFPSTRQSVVEGGPEYNAIIDSVIEHVKSDPKLDELNTKAAEEMAEDEETVSAADIQKDVQLFIEASGGVIPGLKGPASDGNTSNNSNMNNSGSSGGSGNGGGYGGRKKKPEIIKLNEPPTYIKFLWDQDVIKFHSRKEMYIPIRTDASNVYDDNIIIDHDENFSLVTRTRLKDGRLRFCLRCNENVKVGSKGQIKIFLKSEQSGINLSDTKNYYIKEVPKDGKKARPNFPKINIIAVDGEQDDKWERLFEDYDNDPDKNNEQDVSFFFREQNDAIVVYWNTRYGPYMNMLSKLQKRDSAKAPFLKEKYKRFLMCYSYIQFDRNKDKDKSKDKTDTPENSSPDNDLLLNKLSSEARKAAATSSLIIATQFINNN